MWKGRLVLVLIVTCYVLVYNSTLYDILEVSKEATIEDIKKSYRKLAREYHPDKIPMNATAEYRETAKAMFLDIQHAYEVLSDEEQRLKYDLSEIGVQYDIAEKEVLHRYTSAPFKMHIVSRRFTVDIWAHFTKPKVPHQDFKISVPLQDTYREFRGTYTYYRDTICPVCGGNGGLNGSTRQCSHCGGTGMAYHHFQHSHWHHLTHTTCGSCHGTGYIPQGTCTHCKGAGTIKTQFSIDYILPAGFANGYQIGFSGIGNQRSDGRTGDITLSFFYSLPEGYSIRAMSLDLVTAREVPIENLLRGYSGNITAPSGEVAEIILSAEEVMEDITSDREVVIPHLGLLDSAGDRGNLIITIRPSWEGLSLETWIRVLEECGIDVSDSRYELMVELYHIYTSRSSASENDEYDIDPIDVIFTEEEDTATVEVDAD